MAKIKIKQRAFPTTPALAGKSPKDLDSIKKQIAQMVLMHKAVQANRIKKGALGNK